jgi:hypothetical protein
MLHLIVPVLSERSSFDGFMERKEGWSHQHIIYEVWRVCLELHGIGLCVNYYWCVDVGKGLVGSLPKRGYKYYRQSILFRGMGLLDETQGESSGVA